MYQMALIDENAQQCLYYAMAGFMGFVCGAYYQQEMSIRELFGMIRSDPNIFHQRQKLYPILSTFRTDHEARLWKRSTCVSDKIRNCLIFSLYDSISSLLFDRKPPVYTPDLLDLIKYGLPSNENLYVHKDYIVSQDLRTNAPKWICEHLRGNFRRLTTDDAEGDSLHLRYNDVFVLSCGGTRHCKAFQREIWRKLEQHVTRMTEKYDSVYAYTGPMYLPTRRPGENWSLEYQIVDWIPLPMPSHYFKILIIDPKIPDSTPYMEGYIIDNKNTTTSNSCELQHHLCDIGEIERHTGLRFFEGMQSVVRFEKEKCKADRITRFQYLSESFDALHDASFPN
ncbi:endonuclease G, mitochondrial [Drosophila sulfurigaster albostrigata]|uniref:endonuclease G, mitochondrial n=1 Tax=Drosophila sulfurigaster albostrigata TaxID=89887 RepID=UPI002D219BF0|nr:endonuclease G, mitochondrial [Drosophila sulfurigaster albostrigata]